MKTLNMHPAITTDTDTRNILNLDFGLPFEQQVRQYIENIGDARGFKRVVLVGQSVGATLMLPALEMLGGLPEVGLYGFGKDATLLGWLDLADYRHHEARPRRSEISEGEAFAGFTVLDGGGRGLTPLQTEELAKQLDCPEDAIRVINIDMGHVDFAKPQEGMVEKLLATGLTKGDWTSGRVLYLGAGSGLVAAVMACTIHGLSESWPRTLRLNRQDDGQFHLAELVDPQAMRQWAVSLAKRIEVLGAPVSVPRELFNQLVETASAELRVQLLALVE